MFLKVRGSTSRDAVEWKERIILEKDIKVVSKLGEGSFGVVYQVEWRNGDCAMKQAKDALEGKALDEFRAEAALMM